MAHRIAKAGLDQRVDHDRGAAARLLHRDVEILGVLDARVPDFLERLIRELRLERQHEPLGRLSRRVGDDVKLDWMTIVVRAHPREAIARTVVCFSRLTEREEQRWRSLS